MLHSVLSTALAMAATKPNILMLVIDDLGFNDLGYMQARHGFGSPAVRTPTINALASSGILLDSYYVDTVCSPTRATLLTGRYPIHNSINDFVHVDVAYGLPLNETTLPELLKEEGYRTHAIGKWHLGYCVWEYTPTFRGFDSFYGYYEGAEDYFQHTRSGPGGGGGGGASGDESNVDAYDLHHEEGARCGAGCSAVPDRRGEYSVHVFSAEAVGRIEAAAAAAEPFFIYLAYQSIHSPHQAPQEYIDAYTRAGNWTGSEAQKVVAAMLTALDDGIANVTAALAKAGVADDTFVIFTSDNGGTGGSSNFPLRGEKHSVYEGGVRGAAFATGWGIKGVAGVGGTTSSALMHGADWLPTLVRSVAGGSTQGKTLPLDGVDQWLVLTTPGGHSGPALRNETIYGHEKGPTNCGLRNGTWKLLRAGGDKPSVWDPPGYGLGNSTAAATAEAAAASCAAPNVTSGTCYPGDDLSHAENVTSASACCTLCAASAKCKVFLWHTDNLRCFLKSGLAKKGSPGNCVVGGTAPAPPHQPTPAPPSAGLLLFDLDADPFEHTDVSAAHPDVVGSMLARLADIDRNLHQAVPNASCPKRTPATDPVVGNVWMPCGKFNDVPSNFVAPAKLAVATEEAAVALETGAPTPAPTSADSGSPIGAIVGAVVAVGAIAARRPRTTAASSWLKSTLQLQCAKAARRTAPSLG